MNIIIDTHILLWSVFEPDKLSRTAKAELVTPSNSIHVSAISIVEVMIKNTIGKLNIDANLIEVVETCGFEMLCLDGHDALTLGNLPMHHKDPFDRILIAQAITRNYCLMSNDKKFKQYDCKLIS